MLEIRYCNLFLKKTDYIHSMYGIFRIILGLNEAEKLIQPLFLSGQAIVIQCNQDVRIKL